MSKGLEALDRTIERLQNGEKIIVRDYNTIENELQALEIIRNIGILKPYEMSGGQCWLETMCDATKITKDSCDLLKEVLEDE